MLKNFTRDMVTYLPSMLLPALTGFISAPILTRLFLPAEYGNWALADGISAFLIALAISGFAAAAMRFFPAYKVKSKLGIFFATLNRSVGILIASVSAFSFCVLFLLRGYLPAELIPLLYISILVFAVQSVFETYMIVARAQERSWLYSVFVLLVRYGALGAGLLLVIVFGFRVEGLMWGAVAAPGLALPFLIPLIIKGVTVSQKQFSYQDATQIWRYAWPISLGNMAMWGLRLSDRYILNFFRSGSEVGQYSVAYNLSSKSIDMLVMLFLLSMGPIVINTWESQGRDATERIVTMITRLFLILCLPAAAGLTVLSYPFVALLTAKSYHEGYRIVGYVAFSSFAWGLSQIAARGLLISKDTNRIALNQILATLVNLSLNLVLIPRFGFVAAGFTTLVGYTILFILQAYTSRPYLNWQFPFKTLRNVVIATACMGLAASGVYGLSSTTKSAHMGYLFLSIIVAVLVYFGSLFLLCEMTQEEKIEAKRLMRRITAKGSTTS